MEQDDEILTGSCLCGKVQYQVDSLDSTRMAHCHCVDCRKSHGAAFSTFAETTSLKWINGSNNELTEFVASNGSIRQFCRTCGSSMTFKGSKDSCISNYIEFSLATVDTIPKTWIIRPDAHVFCRSKVSWIDIDGDKLPQYPDSRNSEPKRIKHPE